MRGISLPPSHRGYLCVMSRVGTNFHEEPPSESRDVYGPVSSSFSEHSITHRYGTLASGVDMTLRIVVFSSRIQVISDMPRRTSFKFSHGPSTSSLHRWQSPTRSAHTLSRTSLVFELPLHFAPNTLQHVLGHILGLPSERARSFRSAPIVCTIPRPELCTRHAPYGQIYVDT